MAQVRLTASFRRSLVQVEAFLREVEAIAAYDELLDDLLNTVIPNLEKFPDMGRDFLARPAASVETAHGVERLRRMEAFRPLREYVLPPYLLLYATDEHVADLLSIRHHRQLSFDFPGLWNDV